MDKITSDQVRVIMNNAIGLDVDDFDILKKLDRYDGIQIIKDMFKRKADRNGDTGERLKYWKEIKNKLQSYSGEIEGVEEEANCPTPGN